MGSDDAVVLAARVSTKTESVDATKDAGLINYLMRDRHGSPFEHNAFTFYIEAPIFVFREFQRHRIASYNEESARYKQLDPVFYVPGLERKLIQKGKPGAYTFELGDLSHLTTVYRSTYEANKSSYEEYQKMLDAGVAREVARGVLPVNIYSSMFVTMNARSLMNFLSLRTDRAENLFPSFPQREIEMVAEQMEAVFAERMPITYDCFNKNGRVTP
jgi:thymidylate synthase (FAD)